MERRLADGTTERLAEGYEQEVKLSAVVNKTTISWTERRLLVRSLLHTQSAQKALQTRLKRAQEAIEALETAVLQKRGRKEIECEGRSVNLSETARANERDEHRSSLVLSVAKDTSYPLKPFW